MASVPYSYDFQQVCIPGKYGAASNLLMDKTEILLNERGGKARVNSVFPTTIGINVLYNGYEPSLYAIRTFMKQLRSIHQSHFVRFVTDTLWAMESGNGDIFYASDVPKEEWCDAIWTINVLDMAKSKIEVSLAITNNYERQGLLADLSMSLRHYIPKSVGEFNDEQTYMIMKRLYSKANRLYQAGYLPEPLHVMILPTRNGNGFYPVALYGMSYADGKRKHRGIETQLDRQRYNHADYFPVDITPTSILYMLLSSIQDNDNFGVNQKAVKETYGLAEMAFSYWSGFQAGSENTHDFVLFNIADRATHAIDVTRSAMSVFAN